jgi:hypothetical protein
MKTTRVVSRRRLPTSREKFFVIVLRTITLRVLRALERIDWFYFFSDERVSRYCDTHPLDLVWHGVLMDCNYGIGVYPHPVTIRRRTEGREMLYTNGPPHHLLCSHLVAGQGITKVIGFETSKSPCHVRCPIHC